MKKFLFVIAIGMFLLAGGYFWAGRMDKKEVQTIAEKQETQVVPENESVETQNIPAEKREVQETPKENISQKIELKVPFVVQAPFGDWKNENFQNGCEEAAMIMAMGWVNNVPKISAEKSKKQIEDIVKFENEELGYSADTNLSDMQKVFQKYFKQSVEVRENIKIDDIKSELAKENLVLVPAFGRALGNPNYTSPGPITHMLVIIGYDPASKKFITNDSGTRKGKGYQYAEKVLFDAIWEYPSGKIHPNPPTGALKKGMIVVKQK